MELYTTVISQVSFWHWHTGISLLLLLKQVLPLSNWCRNREFDDIFPKPDGGIRIRLYKSLWCSSKLKCTRALTLSPVTMDIIAQKALKWVFPKQNTILFALYILDFYLHLSSLLIFIIHLTEIYRISSFAYSICFNHCLPSYTVYVYPCHCFVVVVVVLQMLGDIICTVTFIFHMCLILVSPLL